jgi:hypothetical protein
MASAAARHGTPPLGMMAVELGRDEKESKEDPGWP